MQCVRICLSVLICVAHVYTCMCVYRDEGGSLSNNRIIEILEAVRGNGSVEDKISLLEQLRQLLDNNPAMCEQFFIPLHDDAGQYSNLCVLADM